MKKRKLGSQGLEASEIGLGCMGMTYAYGRRDDASSMATIDRALELGVDFFDTAEVYGPFSNEELLGRALGVRRSRVKVATKFGFKLEGERTVGLDSQPAHIREVVEASLRRLGTDHIDLLYQHRVDPEVPIEDVAGTVGELVREGKVCFFGLSEAGVETIRKAHAVHPVSALQNEYSLWERSPESGVMDVLDELDIGLVAYSPLGRGFLTGSTTRAEEYERGDYRRRDPRYQGDHFDRNSALVGIVSSVASRLGATPAQVALAWLLQRDPRIVPIPGTKRVAILEENAAAAEVRLDAKAIDELDALIATHPTAGSRYAEPMMAYLGR